MIALPYGSVGGSQRKICVNVVYHIIHVSYIRFFTSVNPFMCFQVRCYIKLLKTYIASRRFPKLCTVSLCTFKCFICVNFIERIPHTYDCSISPLWDFMCNYKSLLEQNISEHFLHAKNLLSSSKNLITLCFAKSDFRKQ